MDSCQYTSPSAKVDTETLSKGTLIVDSATLDAATGRTHAEGDGGTKA